MAGAGIFSRGGTRGFFADEDRNFFLECLGGTAGEESVAVRAYVLMTNHVHLLMTAAAHQGVPTVLKRVGQRYVQRVNRTYHRKGQCLSN
jgi:putative transposase